MNAPSPDGWDKAAAAWIAEQGEDGDYGRTFVLDAPMVERIRERGFKTALMWAAAKAGSAASCEHRASARSG